MLDTLEAAMVASNLGLRTSESQIKRDPVRPDIWAMAASWPGHDVVFPNRQPGEPQIRPRSRLLSPEWRTALARTGIAALLLVIAIFSQQILVSALTTIERVGHAAEIQGAVAKPLANQMADQRPK